jgi:RHS repeat-associated protein
MSFLQRNLLCHYRYDPLGRLINQTQADVPELQRFYCKSRMATEIQGAMQHSIVQHGDQLLAQRRCEGDVFSSALLATDQQRSVLHTIDKDLPPQTIAYSPYGHRCAESGLSSLFGFAGERPDEVTGHYLLGNGHRAFNPMLMRFNSPDNLSPFGKGGLNAYGYCLGDPINFHDPSGQNGIGVAVKIARWRGRAKMAVAGQAEFESKLGKTRNLVLWDHGPKEYRVRPGISDHEAVMAYSEINDMHKRQGALTFLQAKYMKDLDSSTELNNTESFLYKMSPADRDRFNVLSYIKKRPGESRHPREMYSKKRLSDAARGIYDSQWPKKNRPSPDVAKQYADELKRFSPGADQALDEKRKIIVAVHFIRQENSASRTVLEQRYFSQL